MSRSHGFLPQCADAPVDAAARVRFGWCPNPGCGAPAEIYAETVAFSTDGSISHARTYCLNRHFFLLPVDCIRFQGSADLRP